MYNDIATNELKPINFENVLKTVLKEKEKLNRLDEQAAALKQELKIKKEEIKAQSLFIHNLLHDINEKV